MKKPDSKKSYSNFKGSGARNNFERTPRSEKATLRKPYQNKNISTAPYIAKAPYAPFAGKLTYRGKEARLAGASRNETRVAYGFGTRSHHRSEVTSRTRVVKEPETKKEAPAVDTSWGGVADWYDKHLEKDDDTYHTKVIFPNLIRILGDVTGKNILDLACGQGIFSQQLSEKGANVTGVDIGKELIAIAEEKNKETKNKVKYFTTKSDDLYMLKDKTFDIVVCILALQNIEELQNTINEASRVLVVGGKLIVVLNHPAFRNPKQTYWGYNEKDNVQYRRVDEYMSESHVRIDMTPGSVKDKKFTVSFHRPLQVYIKALTKNSLVVTRLEEWISHRESERGTRKKAEDKSRKEIPLFMCIEVMKLGN
ncbi:MAG: methyltransferase domain-containing protein [Candidatus Paceibacterota bacterium]|jgi:ubiquinone/menaquinone biosynthesis C-methylase UbiE